MTSSSEQTTALIAAHMLAQPHASKWLVDEALAGVVPPVWDAIEAVFAPRVVSTVAELDALPGNSVLYSETCWAVLRKQSHLGNQWVTDHASHNRHAISATETLAWAQDWELLRVGGTE